MSYNKKLSGCKAVFVPIVALGKNYIPYVEDLKNRYIKYIDFYGSQYLPDISATGLTTTNDMFLTLADKSGNQLLVKEMPLARFDYLNSIGIRQPIGNIISLQDSYITCTDANQVGKVAMLIFWYDLPEYSRANKAELTVTDSLTIPLTTAVRHNIFPDEERMALKRFRQVLLTAPTTTPDYQTGVTTNELVNIYITLRKGTYNVVENLPIMFLWQIFCLEKQEFANIVFDLQNSYLTIGGANTIPTLATDYLGKSVFINLVYEK